jgi:CHAT domain-containing protein/Tfp pilus assembly protein PilF
MDFNSIDNEYKSCLKSKQYVKAEEILLSAIRVKDSFLPRELSSLYYYLGWLYNTLGNYDDAITNFNKAIKLITDSSQYEEALPSIYLNLGSIYVNKNLYPQAEEFYEKSLRASVNTVGPDLISDIYRGLGLVNNLQKDYPNSLRFLYESLNLKRKYNFKGIGFVLVDLAKVNEKIGNFSEADSLFSNGIAVTIEESGNGNRALAEIYFSYGNFLLKTGKTDQAFLVLRRARNIAMDVYGRKHTLTSLANKNIADAFLSLNNCDSAFYYYQQSLVSVVRDFENMDIYSNPDPLNNTVLYGNRLLENLKRKSIAFELKAAEQGDIDSKIVSINAGLNTINKAHNLVDIIRSNYFSEENKIFLAGNQKETYLSAVRIMNELYALTGADSLKAMMYSVSQEAKAATLLNEITGNALLYSPEIPDSLRARLKSLQKEIQGCESKIQNEYSSNKPDQNLIDALNDMKFKMNREKDTLDKQMANLIPGYHELLRRTDPLPYEAVRKRLNRNETVIDYLLSPPSAEGKRKLFVFVLTHRKLEVMESEIDSIFLDNAKIIKDASDNMLSSKSGAGVQGYISALNYMYRTLIQPVENKVSGKKLIIIPDEELEYLPFEAFVRTAPEPDRTDFEGLKFLINDYTISYNYSSSFIGSEKNHSDLIRINAFSPSYSGPGVASLAGAEEETMGIHKFFKGESFTGEKVTRSLFIDRMADSAIIHLALHTMIDSLNSKFSYMLFSPADSNDNGRLYNYEVSLGRLRSPMVVLSSCNSGEGTLYSGAGLMSIARSFFLAGARSVVKTSWAVNDGSGSEIIGSFYHNLSKGMRKDEALRQAKLEFIKKSPPAFSNPYYWAAYSVLGDTRAVEKNKNVTIVTILAVILISAGLIFYLKRRRIF